MKKLVSVLLVLSFVLSFNAEVIPLSQAENNNTEKIELISSYIKSLKKEVQIFKKKYEIKNHKNLENELDEIDNLLDILQSVEKTDIEKDDEEQIVLIVLERLKKSKDTIKNIIKVKKELYEKEFKTKRELYLKISEKLNKQLNSLIVNVYNVYKNRENLGEKEIAVIKILKELNNENVKLKNFGNIKFNSQNEMTTSMVRILNRVKKRILELREVGK